MLVVFKQIRKRKITTVISDFIYDATIRANGFISASILQFQILNIFNVLITTKTLSCQRKLLSKLIRTIYIYGRILIFSIKNSLNITIRNI